VTRLSRNPQQGSLVLVALCLVAVLGIALASYLSVSLQAMKLSNRSIQTSLSSHLAEIGLEEAMRAFNTNNWATYTSGGTTFTWAINPNGTSASCTIALPATLFTKSNANGVTGSIKIRVDNFNAYNLPAIWTTPTNYQINDLMGDSGIWYRCVANHTSSAANRPPNQSYWAETPIAWMWNKDITYAQYDTVNYNGVWYTCTSANTNQVPPNASYWYVIPLITLPWSSSTTYQQDSVAYSTSANIWYRYTNAVASSGNLVSNATYWTPVPSATPYFSFRWGNSITYSPNALVYRSGQWYRCIFTNFNSGPPNATYWQDATGVYWVWNSGKAYNIGDVVFSGGVWYRCIQAHSNQGPPNASYWSSAPLLPVAWDSGRQYSLNATAFYNGIWYRCLSANNSTNPAFNAASWGSATNAAYQWSSATTYSAGSYVTYGKVWYLCILAPTAHQTPNNVTYWRALGAPVIYAEGTATLPDGSATITTQLRATVAVAPLFPNAIAATSTLTISGGGTVDSYDASSGTYNQATAPYSGSPYSNLGYSAVLAGGNTAATAVTMVSTTVQGYVAAPSASTSPYAPLWTSGVMANLIGSPGFGIDLQRVSRSPYIPQFDIHTVGNAVNFTIFNNTTNTIGTPGARQPTVYNITSSFNRINLTTLSPQDILIVNGPVILNVSSDFNISNGKMIITSTGSAEIHFGGNLAISGANGIDNRTLNPKKLILISNASAGTYNFTSTMPFYGCIYLPNATNPLTIGAGTTIYGALSANKITFSGDANLHYDTSLRYAAIGGVDTPYVISEWRELTDPVERVVLP
jgi:hypothetical protein